MKRVAVIKGLTFLLFMVLYGCSEKEHLIAQDDYIPIINLITKTNLQNLINDAHKKDGRVDLKNGKYYCSNIILRNNIIINGKDKDSTLLICFNNGEGASISDSGASLNCKIQNISIIRTGTDEYVKDAGQKNRYTIHLFGEKTQLLLTNVKIYDSNFNLGENLQENWAGLISIVNESGIIKAINCDILSHGRGIYQPTSIYKNSPETYWQGNITTRHKSISIHRGKIIGKGKIICENDTKDIGACLSTCGGILDWNGEIINNGAYSLIWNSDTAKVKVKANATSCDVGLYNIGTGSIEFNGSLSAKTLIVNDNPLGLVLFNGEKY